MHRVATKFVPRLMSDEQKAHQVNICQKLLERAVADPIFLENIIIGDEMWFHGYDVGTKVQSSQWKLKMSPKPKKTVCAPGNAVEVKLV